MGTFRYQLQLDAMTVRPFPELLGHVSSRHVHSEVFWRRGPLDPKLLEDLDLSRRRLLLDLVVDLKTAVLIHDRVK